MRETRREYDPQKMVDGYVDLYETLSGGMPFKNVERTREPILDLDDPARGKWFQFAYNWNAIGNA